VAHRPREGTARARAHPGDPAAGTAAALPADTTRAAARIGPRPRRGVGACRVAVEGVVIRA